MKKYILAIPFILALSAPVMAQKVSFKEVIDSSPTIINVSCSSSTATLIDSTTTAAGLIARTFVAIQNFDTTNPVCIGFSSAMSCASGAIKVPENLAIVSIPVTLLKLASNPVKYIQMWCKTSSTTGASSIAVVQGF